MNYMAETSPFGLYIDGAFQIPDNLAELIHRHSFICFRNMPIDDAQFTSMAEQLGPPIQYGFGTVLNMEKREDAAESQFSNAGMALHQDSILNRFHDALFLSFKCIDAPAHGGGETLLSNNRLFLRIIPKKLLEELRSVTIAYRSMSPGYYSGDGGASRPIEHKALKPHPRTGEEMLYIALDDPTDEHRNYAAEVIGYTKLNSQRFMKEVDHWLRRPEILHPHAWREGDVLIVDNHLVCHGRTVFQQGDKRRLIRIAIAAGGSGP